MIIGLGCGVLCLPTVYSVLFVLCPTSMWRGACENESGRILGLAVSPTSDGVVCVCMCVCVQLGVL